MHPSKRKGNRAEREVAALLTDLLGVSVVRRHNIGTHEDIGDLILQDTVIQVADWKDVTRAVREKPLECEEQLRNSWNGDPAKWPLFAATFVRLRGGEYRVVLTPEQWAAMWREAV